ncbi:MAG: VWA domain-containing protein [Parcubacteria group bacterium]|nr:VWA domain-containing protein [Parcubacteria group bacterium]
MEGVPVIETKKDENGVLLQGDHAEAFAFVKEHLDFFEHYAKGGIKIEPAPAGLNTFAFDLNNNTIYINALFYEKLGLSEEKTIFATLHEIEHFLEKIALLNEEGGEKILERYIKKIKTSRAFSLMDNCVADIRENRTVVSKTNKGMKTLEEHTYKEVLFPETDLTHLPRHIQFCQALLREARVADEQCSVSPDVREKIDELRGVKGLMDIMTHPETPMSVRLKLQDKYVWPRVEALLTRDKEDKKKEESQNKNSETDRGKEGTQEKNNNTTQGEQKEKPEKGETNGDDPNTMFADDYREAEKKVPNAVPIEDIEKAFKEWKEEKNKNSPESIDQDYAEKLGVEKKDLQEYRRIVEALQTIVHPETNVGIIEELKNLFSRIIAKRLKEKLAPQYPVEEGDELVDPAQLVSDVKSGNLRPKVWEDTEIKEKKGDRFGEVEITLICDRSSSMNEGGGQKAVEQRNVAVLMMEVLKDFAELCDEEKRNVDTPLEVKSEVYSFAGSEEDRTPLKKMGKELGEAERIHVLKKLFDLPGSTTDFNCLEAISEGLNNETKEKIATGELKKIVFVLTDGGSDSASRVQQVLKQLRGSGIVVVGIGLTEAGRSAVTTYAPDAQVVYTMSDLPIVLGELLKEHLKNI